MLGRRELQIVNQLLSASAVVRTRDLADQMGVSIRTIKYDLERVRDWFSERQVVLFSQPNKGYWLECDASLLMELRHELSQAEHLKLYTSRSMRVRRILVMLLLSEGYVTAALMADEIDVSRNTILADMNEVERMAGRFHVKLSREQRSGYRILGEERRLRSLLEHLLVSNMNNYEVYKITTRITRLDRERNFQPMFDRRILPEYELVESALAYYFQDESREIWQQLDIMIILVRLTISLKRLQMGHAMDGYQVLDIGAEKSDARRSFIGFMQRVYLQKEFPLLRAEYRYCVGSHAGGMLETDIAKLTEDLIGFVARREGVDYELDQKLYTNLFAHLSLRLGQGGLSGNEFNPLNSEIKQQYPTLFGHVYEACKKFISDEQVIQESFISFIVLHFLVSLENQQLHQRKVRTLYVCSTGRGVARLIKNRVEAGIGQVEMVAYCSIVEVEEMCRKHAIELIISVFPIESSLPVVVTDALPKKADLEMIRQEVARILLEMPAVVDDYETVDLVRQSSHEEISEEIILKGFEVYQQVKDVLANEVDLKLENGLLLHIFLMVQRYYFNKQYDLVLASEDSGRMELKERLTAVFEQCGLYFQEAELEAVVHYFK
ncbi:HTH domain-containing protein [Listeria rocourtiae]|uniref:BglG family transcription antiterminator n=1 Tax=Listeria rocourtiae TaxID=647910 RepID=UPI003D2F8E6D